MTDGRTHYPGGIVILVRLDDFQVQDELGQHQEGIQDDQTNDDDLQTEEGTGNHETHMGALFPFGRAGLETSG